MEQLKHYAIHIFTDGTIIFLENGVVQPPGRAPLAGHMRGKVGFGAVSHVRLRPRDRRVPDPADRSPGVGATRRIRSSGPAMHRRRSASRGR